MCVLEYKNPVISRMLSSHIRKRKTLFITMNTRTKTGTKESNLPSINIVFTSFFCFVHFVLISSLRSLCYYFFTPFFCFVHFVLISSLRFFVVSLLCALLRWVLFSLVGVILLFTC